MAIIITTILTLDRAVADNIPRNGPLIIRQGRPCGLFESFSSWGW